MLKKLAVRLADSNEGEGWSVETVDAALTHYCNFLELIQRHPEESLVPLQAVDTVWHFHILDTRAYTTWCMKTFGAYLHHDPNYGRGSKKNLDQLQASFDRTAQLYEAHFGVSYSSNLKGPLALCSGRVCNFSKALT